jgi:hypothetical protein
MKMATMGLDMLKRGRMTLKPTRIEQIDQLQAILAEAKKVGGNGHANV